MYPLYPVYVNVQKCLHYEEYRGYTRVSDVLDEKEFINQIQKESYCVVLSHDKNKNTVITVVASDDSFHFKDPSSFKKLIQILTKNHIKGKSKKATILTVTKNAMSVYIGKAIAVLKASGIIIKTYYHHNFSTEILKDPKMPKYKILDKDEKDRVLYEDLLANKESLPYYDNENDVACVWLGVSVGDIVKVEYNSHLAGKYISYRIFLNDHQKESRKMAQYNEERFPELKIKKKKPKKDYEIDGISEEIDVEEGMEKDID